MDPFTGMIALLALGWALHAGAQHARRDYRRGRENAVQEAEKAAAPAPLGKGARRGAVRAHRTAWWTREVSQGFPVLRTGAHAGWLAHRAAAVQQAAKREEQRTTSLEARASFLPSIREHRDRQQAAMREIEEALAASSVKQDGSRRKVREAAEAVVLPFRPRKAQTPAEAHESALAGTCSHGGHGPDGDTCSDIDDALAKDSEPPSPSTEGEQAMPLLGRSSTEALIQNPNNPGGFTLGGGRRGSAEITYDETISQAGRIISEAEAEIARLNMSQIMNMVENLAASCVDPGNLSRAADIHDAIQAQKKAAQQVLDNATALRDGLRRDHGGIAEAHQSAPVEAANKEFYDN